MSVIEKLYDLNKNISEFEKTYYQNTIEEFQNLHQLKKNIKKETNDIFLFYQLFHESYERVVLQLNNDIKETLKKLKKFDQENILLKQQLGRLQTDESTIEISNYKRLSEIRQTRSLNLIRSAYVFEIQECYNYFEDYEKYVDIKIEEYQEMISKIIEQIELFHDKWTNINTELHTYLNNNVFSKEIYDVLVSRCPSLKGIIDHRDFLKIEKLKIIQVSPNVYYDSYFMSEENNNSNKRKRA